MDLRKRAGIGRLEECKEKEEGMRRRHIRLMAKMRLSELIRSEDARTGRKNVTTVAGMVGASALGALILGMAQRAFAGYLTTTHCCPETVTLDGTTLTFKNHSVICPQNGIDKRPQHVCTYVAENTSHTYRTYWKCECVRATTFDTYCASIVCWS
jgi:hypothetical protein